MNHLVIGMGEIGTAVEKALRIDGGYATQTLDKESKEIVKPIDVLHICIPYTKTFKQQVETYQIEYEPTLTIVYSTTAIGTIASLKHAVHSPVEGKHPRLYQSVKQGVRWIGYNNNLDKVLAQKIWRPITICQPIECTDWTEFLKLASTSKYGINLVWADYMNKVAKHLNMPYKYVKDWDRDYNILYRDLNMNSNRKFILDPPNGVIGGHCVIPNAEILDEQFPDKMLKMIKEYA